MKTYTNKSNAARAARNSGIEVCQNNLYEIEGGYVYLDKQPSIPDIPVEVVEQVVLPVTPESKFVKVRKTKIQRPKGKISSAIWNIFDGLYALNNTLLVKDDFHIIHIKSGFAITTIRAQYWAWKVFNKLSKV